MKQLSKMVKVGVMSAFAVVLAAAPSFAATSAVTPSDMQGWSTNSYGTAGTAMFVDDESSLGDSALQLKTTDNNADVIQLEKSVSIPLAEVENLSFDSKVLAGPVQANASYAMGVDQDADGSTDFYYVYEPYWQTGGAGVQGEWTTWDVKSGLLWATTDGSAGPPTHTWADVLADNPDGVLSEVVVYMGSYNPGYTVNVDGIVIGETTYDFEQNGSQVPITKDQCKKNGWKSLEDTSGKPFKNQGACVSSVVSSGAHGQVREQ